MKTTPYFNHSNLRCLGIAAFCVFAPPASAFDIIAKLERDANANSGPTEYACTFCPNTSKQLSAHFNGGFPPPAIPVAEPANSQISGDAFADLATGVMRGNSFAASYGHNEQHQMRFVSSLRETIEIDLPPGLPVAERFVTFIGQVTASAAATNRATARAIYSLSAHGVRVAVSRHHADGWNVLDGENNPAIGITPVMNGVDVIGHRFVLRVPIPSSRVMVIESQLESTSWAEARLTTGVGIATSEATSSMTMTLPQGATYESTSNVFLTSSAGDAWRQQYFGTSENSGSGADTADPDGDGTVNLLEFATLTHPLIATTLPIEPVLAGGNVDFIYMRNKAALGEVTCDVESSDTLAPDSWSTAGVTEIILSEDAAVQQIKATLPADAPRRFVRLSVAAAGP